jgi:hypothetical protein
VREFKLQAKSNRWYEHVQESTKYIEADALKDEKRNKGMKYIGSTAEDEWNGNNCI